jgi:hypothetical protein
MGSEVSPEGPGPPMGAFEGLDRVRRTGLGRGVGVGDGDGPRLTRPTLRPGRMGSRAADSTDSTIGRRPLELAPLCAMFPFAVLAFAFLALR